MTKGNKMKKQIFALLGVMAWITVSAETLPNWATGTFKGTLVNWCETYDSNDVGPWYSSAAKLIVEQDGKISGEVRFGALKGTPQGQYTVLSSTDNEATISLKWKWYEKGDVDELGMLELVIRKTADGVEMEYVEKEQLENRNENPYENCPIAGTLTKASSQVDIPQEWQRTRVLRGVATHAVLPPYHVQGIFELKCGKANKQGSAKVSAVLIRLDGSKKSYGVQSVKVTGETIIVDFDGLVVTIDGETFIGEDGLDGGLGVRSADVGGDWSKGGTKVYVDAANASLPAGTLKDFLPDGEPVVADGGKWKFAKAAGVKWAKPKKGDATPDTYDAESGKGLLVDTSGDKTNLSGMKLTYTPKKGTFKGSFKVYALEGSGRTTNLKKYTVKVSGVVVDGVGYGTATCKNPALSWSVTVK